MAVTTSSLHTQPTHNAHLVNQTSTMNPHAISLNQGNSHMTLSGQLNHANQINQVGHMHGTSLDNEVKLDLSSSKAVIAGIAEQVSEIKTEVEGIEGTVAIQDVLDSLVNMRPLYGPKSAHDEDLEASRASEASETLYEFADQLPEAPHDVRGSINPSSSVSTGPLGGIAESLAPAPEPSFACRYCDRVCKKKESLTRHVRHSHSEQPTTCGQCQYLAPNYSALLEHRKREHTANSSGSQTVHKCPQCDFTSNKAENVRRHLTRHQNAAASGSDTRPHKCPFCDHAFARPHLLAKHLASVHGKVTKPNKERYNKQQGTT